MAAREQQFPGVTSVPLLELFAVWYGLQVTQLQGCHQVVVESNSLKAITVLNETYMDSLALGMIVEDVLQLASTFCR